MMNLETLRKKSNLLLWIFALCAFILLAVANWHEYSQEASGMNIFYPPVSLFERFVEYSPVSLFLAALVLFKVFSGVSIFGQSDKDKNTVEPDRFALALALAVFILTLMLAIDTFAELYYHSHFTSIVRAAYPVFAILVLKLSVNRYILVASGK